MNNWCICWFFTHIFAGDFNFKGLTSRRLYKSIGVKEFSLSSRGTWTNRQLVVVSWILRLLTGQDRAELHDTPTHSSRNHALYDTPPTRFVFQVNSEGSKTLPDDGRLLSKHVRANIQNKEVVQITTYCCFFLIRQIMYGMIYKR
jgi:hypothetical protein